MYKLISFWLTYSPLENAWWRVKIIGSRPIGGVCNFLVIIKKKSFVRFLRVILKTLSDISIDEKIKLDTNTLLGWSFYI